MTLMTAEEDLEVDTETDPREVRELREAIEAKEAIEVTEEIEAAGDIPDHQTTTAEEATEKETSPRVEAEIG